MGRLGHKAPKSMTSLLYDRGNNPNSRSRISELEYSIVMTLVSKTRLSQFVFESSLKIVARIYLSFMSVSSKFARICSEEGERDFQIVSRIIFLCVNTAHLHPTLASPSFFQLL